LALGAPVEAPKPAEQLGLQSSRTIVPHLGQTRLNLKALKPHVELVGREMDFMCRECRLDSA
jgi:hypothetical protein